MKIAKRRQAPTPIKRKYKKVDGYKKQPREITKTEKCLPAEGDRICIVQSGAKRKSGAKKVSRFVCAP